MSLPPRSSYPFADSSQAGLRPVEGPCPDLSRLSTLRQESARAQSIALKPPPADSFMAPEPNPEPTPWYRDGLSFSCTRCGACCTGTPGYVWVSVEEIERLAEFRGEQLDDFGSKFLRRVGRRYSLVEKPNGDCIFWDHRQGCTVYPARPVQCQTWPFWDENVETPEDWKQTQKSCPGAGRGQWFSVEQIEAELARGRIRNTSTIP